MSGSFARLVTEGMSRRGLGLRELCRQAELDPSFLSKVLAGKRNPPSDEPSLRRLARALELDPMSLVVAAGRIPSEWGDLSADPELLRRLSALAKRTPQAPPPQEKWRSSPASTPLVRKPFSEELL